MEASGRILIIDDEEVVLDSCSQILKGSGHLFLTARNGEAGLERVVEFGPDLVFVDLKMPGLSGIDVIRRIHELDSSIVSIVITGFATVSSAIDAMQNGAFDFLPKPFTPDEFRMIARRGLEKRRLVLETIALRREKEVLRENFAAIVSHELKSPLAAVQQNLYTLSGELAGQLSEKQTTQLRKIQDRLADLTKLILTWLRVLSVDISKLQEAFRPVQISAVIDKAIDSIQVHAIRKDIDIVVPRPVGIVEVSGDEGTLVEALVNILGNAVKYSRPATRVIVEVEESGREVIVSVTDSGVGISKEDLPHIFGDFYTGKAGNSAEKGTGIGLAVAHRIVEAHHGSIGVVSEPGKGSKFSVRLPILTSEMPE